MTWSKLWVIAYRDLGRHRRRTFFTGLAVALGLALLILLNGWIAGVTDDALQNSIRLQTGHVQLRAPAYEADQLSLAWKDLIADPAARHPALDSGARPAARPDRRDRHVGQGAHREDPSRTRRLGVTGGITLNRPVRSPGNRHPQGRHACQSRHSGRSRLPLCATGRAGGCSRMQPVFSVELASLAAKPKKSSPFLVKST